MQQTRLAVHRLGEDIRDAPPRFEWGDTHAFNWASRTLQAGQILYREGAMPDRLFLLKSGVVKEIAHLSDGRVRIVGLHGPDALLGFESAPTPRACCHSATAIAITEVTAACVSAVELQRIRKTSPELYLHLMERHCETLRQTKRWIKEFYADTTTSRIARAIRYLAELQKLSDDELVELLTCQEMAEIVGVSTESASRVLARFKRLGVLTADPNPSRRRYYHFNPAAVANFADNLN